MTHKLIHGNALHVLPKLASGTFDFIFADPPYFLSNGGFSVKSGKAVPVHKGDWDTSKGLISDFDFHNQWISECLRLLKANGTIAISGTYHSIFQCGFALQSQGARVVNDIVWFKPNGAPALAGRNFTASHETIIWASKSRKAKHTFNYQESKNWDTEDKLKSPGRQMRSVWSIPATPRREKIHGAHPTQKPLELLNRLVRLCTTDEALILDPFCGSGTTGVACVANSRQFIGIDLNLEYLDLTEKRMRAAHEDNTKIEIVRDYDPR